MVIVQTCGNCAHWKRHQRKYGGNVTGACAFPLNLPKAVPYWVRKREWTRETNTIPCPTWALATQPTTLTVSA